MNKLRVATVFSGIGAFEFALKRLSIPHDIIFACDNGELDISYDKEAEFRKIKKLKTPLEKKKYVDDLYEKTCKRKNYMKISYLANYKIKDDLFFQDINLLDGNDFAGDIDILVGGSPCQSFSSVGSQGGLDDVRGTLFYEFARLVNEIQPKVFIYENVRNLLNHDKGKTWSVIQNIFNSLGYNYKFSILNASDYGIPQTRRRLFVVGYKANSNFEMPKPKKIEYSLQDFLLDNCSNGNFKYSKNGSLEVIKSTGKVDKLYYLSPAIYKYVMKGGTKTFYQKPEINKKIARTLLKTMGNRHRAGIDNYVSDDGSNNLGKVRMLTERECLRLMGFTDDFSISVSRAQLYKQAGNSIVVDVLMNLIKQILIFKILEEKS